VFGEVLVEEQIWSSPAQSYIRVVASRLGVQPRGKSRRLQRALTDFGCEQSFAKASQSLREHYGFELGASAVRKATLCHAQRAKERLEKQYEEPFRILPAIGQGHVIAEVDGTMICTVEAGPRKSKKPREWKEMRLVAAQGQESASAVYAATFGTVAETGRRWGHCAKQAGWGLNSEIHAVGDGAEWISLQCQEVFGAQGRFLCDFFHVSEYLGAAAPVCKADRPNPWRRTQQKRVRRGAVDKVLEALAEHLEPAGIADEEAPVRAAHRYLTNRLDCLDYPRADRLGLPIGSGLIESGHRHVLQARLKKAGTAWLRNNADEIAHLRVLRANQQWHSMWN
jgi:hypothetical protein